MDKQIPREILDRLEYDTRKEREDVIVRIKPIETDCEYCGQTVQGREETIRKHQTPTPHWRKRCITCGLYWNPETLKYDLDSIQVLAFFRSKYTTKAK
jgi:hypothetical protein